MYHICKIPKDSIDTVTFGRINPVLIRRNVNDTCGSGGGAGTILFKFHFLLVTFTTIAHEISQFSNFFFTSQTSTYIV